MSRAKVKAKTVPLRNSGYSDAGANHLKRSLKGMPSVSLSTASDINDNLHTLRGRSRHLYMASPIAASAINLNRTNVVGVGLRLKSQIDREVLGLTPEQAEAWEKKAEREFALWAEDKKTCDALGLSDFYEMQGLVCASSLMSGDTFVLIKRGHKTRMRPYTLRLHAIEADRVITPTSYLSYGYGVNIKKDDMVIYDGVEVDSKGRVVAYHVANGYPYDYQNVVESPMETVRIPVEGKKTRIPNILHIMTTERPEQYRGVPYLAHVIEPILQLNRYTDAEITAAVVQTMFTAFVTTQDDPSEQPWNEATEDGAVPEIQSGEYEYQMGPGTINMLAKGEDVKFASPTHPQTGFDVFANAILQQIGAALEIPATVLVKAFKSNYTAARGELMEAWKMFKMRREWLTKDFCQPVYEIFLAEAVASGRISAPGFLNDPIIRKAYIGAKWIGPSQGQLDPLKEVNAAILSVGNGFSTRSDEAIKLGGSEFRANVERLKLENAALREANGGMTEEYGVTKEEDDADE